ncbi:hypothetical protein ATCC90586_012139 [Pythium insidiosum]|nr:hypothetical protein ATCC90586_012139 [Pythium insidiosum]
MTEVELECAVYGEGTVFPVKIARDAKVSALQRAIFDDQRYKERFSFPASALTLYLAKKDGVWLKHDRTVKNFLQVGKSAEYEEEMLSSWKLDDEELFGDDFEPGDKEIHVLVELPDDRRVKNFLQAGKSAEYETEMRPTWTLDDEDYFGDDFQPGHKEIHVLVELPASLVGIDERETLIVQVPTTRQRFVAWALPALNLLALAGFFALDVRDIYYKIVWLGPYDSHSFQAVGTYTYETTPLAPAVNVSSLATGDEVDFVSGFASFLDKCDALYGTTSDLVLSARGTDCKLGAPSNAVVASELVFATSPRVDSIVWTSCKLLFLHRRPAICQENIVTEFFHRYRVSDPVIAPELMAEPNSDAEKELLALLSLISRSHPLSDVVCVEGFEPTMGPNSYSATIFGCASPNVFEAVFVGRYATHFAHLQAEMAWLTVDVLNLLGFDFVIRENSRSSFDWKGVTAIGQGATVEHRTAINFSSFGHFYILIIAIDLILLAAHTRSGLETANVLLLPLLGTTNKDDAARLTREYSWCILYRSLYRSPPIVILTIISGVLSWQLQLPNSIIWTWNEQSSGKANAILSCMRVWMLVVCALHQLWAIVVAVAEPFAYRIAKRTYVSIVEVLIVSAIIAMANQDMLFDVSNDKYDPERQRLWDKVSFQGHTTFSNAFNEELDYLLCTPNRVLRILFVPLLAIIWQSLLVLLGIMFLRAVYFKVRGSSSALAQDTSDSPTEEYQRLPLEELLRTPIRAHSIIRSAFQLEYVSNGKLYIPPSVYYEFGVILDGDIIRTRRGFFNVIHLKVDVAKYFSPMAATTTDTSTAFNQPPTSPTASMSKAGPSAADGVKVQAAVVETDGVKADTPTFRITWCAIASIYVVVCLQMAAYAGFYIVISGIPSVGYYSTLFRLISVSQFPIVTATYGIGALLFLFQIFRLISISLRHKRLCLIDENTTSRVVHAAPGVFAHQAKTSATGTRPTRTNPFVELKQGLTRVFSVKGPYFEFVVLARELIEVLVQIQQAYASSQYTPNVWLNYCYGALIVTNCISTPLLHKLGYSSTDMGHQRLAILLADLLLDIVWFLLPLLLLPHYLSEFFGGQAVMYQDTFMVRALMETRLIFVASHLDLFFKVMPAMGLYLTTRKLRNLLRRAPGEVKPVPRPGIRPTVTTEMVEHQETEGPSVAAIAVYHRTYLPRIVRYRLLAEKMMEGTLLILGIFALVMYVLVVALPGTCASGCLNGELRAALNTLEQPGLQLLIFTHCTELEVPSSIRGFNDLYGLEIYNSTIASWPTDAAITRDVYYQLGFLYLIRTNVASVPDALLTGELPPTLVEIDFIVSNLTTLPDDLDRSYLLLNGNPIQSLPSQLGKLDKLFEVQVQFTNISSLNDIAVLASAPRDELPTSFQLGKR